MDVFKQRIGSVPHFWIGLYNLAARLTLAAAVIGAATGAQPAVLAEETPSASKMSKAEFKQKYKTYLVREHVDYVSSGFADTLIPTTSQVLRENRGTRTNVAELRILVADRLYKDFSPKQFDVVADFTDYLGPDGKSLNVWVKSLQKSIVQGDALKIERPLSWWPIYVGVSEAFENRSVLRWAGRQSADRQQTVQEVIISAVMKTIIRNRYRASAAEACEIICDEYATWYDSPETYNRQTSAARLHATVFKQINRKGRDAHLFESADAETSAEP